MKYYTRRGDEGLTDLYGGQRVSKADARIEAYGALDELNAHLGVLVTLMDDMPQMDDGLEHDEVLHIQEMLFVIGAMTVTDGHSDASIVEEANVARLETLIDRLQAETPPLSSFVLPGGCPAAAQCHVCRTVCRRAERRLVALNDSTFFPEAARHYINRLSDYLFALALKLNFVTHVTEKKVRISCK